jgi:deazaflavin-dependent oxidoreductase (nitroreductase family)
MMGLIEALGYEIPTPNAAQRAMWHVSSSRPGACVPVLTVTTTGARTGQPGTPGWYYNMPAQPRAEVAFRDRSVNATAREADEDQWQQIWAQARNIYGGYQAYASRITNRKIRILILSAP